MKVVSVNETKKRIIARLISPTGTFHEFTYVGSQSPEFTFALGTPADERNFSAQFQRHLRRVDADKIKGKKPKKEKV